MTYNLDDIKKALGSMRSGDWSMSPGHMRWLVNQLELAQAERDELRVVVEAEKIELIQKYAGEERERATRLAAELSHIGEITPGWSIVQSRPLSCFVQDLIDEQDVLLGLLRKHIPVFAPRGCTNNCMDGPCDCGQPYRYPDDVAEAFERAKERGWGG